MCARLLRAGEDAEFRESFLALGGSGASGTIQRPVFVHALGALDVDCTEAFELFSSLDANNNGEIEYSEFLAAVLPFNSICALGTAEEVSCSLLHAFARFDASDGTIDGCSFRDALGVDAARAEEFFRHAASRGRVASTALASPEKAGALMHPADGGDALEAMCSPRLLGRESIMFFKPFPGCRDFVRAKPGCRDLRARVISAGEAVTQGCKEAETVGTSLVRKMGGKGGGEFWRSIVRTASCLVWCF